MTRLLVLLAALILLAAAGAGAAVGQVAGTAAAVAQTTPSPPPENPPGTFGTFLSENHEAFRTYGLIIGGVAGLIFAFWRARIATRQAEAAAARADAAIGQARAANEQARAANEQARAANEQARIAEQGHITERFSRAVEQLGSEQLPVRLGGIYTLWRLIKDSPERDVISVIDILCAFVRHPPHETGQDPDPRASEDGQALAREAEKAGPPTGIRPDVQTVLDRLGTKKAVYRALLPDGYRLDLTGANLTRARLKGADFSGADLTGAFLSNALLKDANLANANLINANLTDTLLMNADLSGVDLSAANLTRAYLRDANLTGANLWIADLTGATLTDANLTDANLWVADTLTQDQLDSACISKDGKPPDLLEGLKPPDKFCVPRPQ